MLVIVMTMIIIESTMIISVIIILICKYRYDGIRSIRIILMT